MRRVATLILLLCLPLVAFGDISSVTVSVYTPQCADGIDNDGDLLIDHPSDLGCSSAGDNDETDVSYQCNDSIDNDGDLLIDYPTDPGCDNATAQSHSVTSGNGASSSLL